MEANTKPVTREDISERAKWNLDGLYAQESLWQEDFKKLEGDISGYKFFKNTLVESAGKIKACLEFDIDISRKMEKLYTYAHLRNDEDKTHSKNQGNFEKVVRLQTIIAQAASYIPSELMAIPEDRMNKFLNEEELGFYRLHLERILRYRKHVLSGKEEKLKFDQPGFNLICTYCSLPKPSTSMLSTYSTYMGWLITIE